MTAKAADTRAINIFSQFIVAVNVLKIEITIDAFKMNIVTFGS